MSNLHPVAGATGDVQVPVQVPVLEHLAVTGDTLTDLTAADFDGLDPQT